MTKLRAAAISFAGGHPQAYSGGLASHPDVKLVGVAEVLGEPGRRDMAEAFAEQYGAPHFEDYAEMLDAVRPDVVSLCVPPARNAEVIIAAAERGVHILSEKPAADSLASAERALAAVKEAGVCFSLDVPNACFPRPLADAQARVASGGIGEPLRRGGQHGLGPGGADIAHHPPQVHGEDLLLEAVLLLQGQGDPGPGQGLLEQRDVGRAAAGGVDARLQLVHVGAGRQGRLLAQAHW